MSAIDISVSVSGLVVILFLACIQSRFLAKESTIFPRTEAAADGTLP